MVDHKNKDMAFQPASLTKIMTCYMVLKECNSNYLFEEMVTISQTVEDEKNGTNAFLKKGDCLSVLDLL